MNSHLVAEAIVLGANTDSQPVLTAKGVADYVAKYITKYGTGQSVSSRIASLLGDIVTRTPVGKELTTPGEKSLRHTEKRAYDTRRKVA